MLLVLTGQLCRHRQAKTEPVRVSMRGAKVDYVNDRHIVCCAHNCTMLVRARQLCRHRQAKTEPVRVSMLGAKVDYINDRHIVCCAHQCTMLLRAGRSQSYLPTNVTHCHSKPQDQRTLDSLRPHRTAPSSIPLQPLPPTRMIARA